MGPVANLAKKGEPNRKQAARLEARRADYTRTISNPKQDYSGYRRPGSNKK